MTIFIAPQTYSVRASSRLTAFWETRDSVQATQQSRKSPTWDEAYVQTHTYRRNSHLQAYATLIDPFLALHLYSSLLPITSLTLPPWTWQQAMHKMTALFHIGPVLVTENVPEYMVDKRLGSENYNLTKTQLVNTAPAGILTLQSGDWAWLQPYMDELASKLLPGKPGDEPDPEAPNRRLFIPLAMRPVDERARFEKGLYTALEGYLQLSRRACRWTRGRKSQTWNRTHFRPLPVKYSKSNIVGPPRLASVDSDWDVAARWRLGGSWGLAEVGHYRPWETSPRVGGGQGECKLALRGRVMQGGTQLASATAANVCVGQRQHPS
ncbi:hypothetical protein COCVIDRAFT_31440 [Bipolaris victoriae FI3]|uniref:Uncharacterized protein n=1 Tax=Bipolaris victoriae (strain FI3) TaxID=930091 RepID=W7E5T0_BIPV3|nr:hypothetical protein COCVIDRAFT_31440 [Bipolaris victoriae FI3]